MRGRVLGRHAQPAWTRARIYCSIRCPIDFSNLHWRPSSMLKGIFVLLACALMSSEAFRLAPGARIFKPLSHVGKITNVKSTNTALFAGTSKDKKEAVTSDQAARQLMGIKGAAETKNIWAIRLQLMKPVTWIPLIWGVACGAAASGNYHTWNPFASDPVPLSLVAEDAAKAFTCMMLSGPLLTGYTQTINDWEDRAIDAINEPYRPIPSGAISEGQVISQIWVLLLAGLGLAYGLDQWAGHADPIIFKLSLFGSFISYIYSAPPLKLKATGWAGSFALGSSYISLPWLCGQAMFGELSWQVTLLTIFYSLAGLGIAIVNDFKSIEGDRALGLQSLPVAFGVDAAKWLTVGTIDITQLLVAAYLFYIQETSYGLALLALIAPQVFFQVKYFLPDPIKNDVKYQASAQPFLVLGILTTALAVGHHGPL